MTYIGTEKLTTTGKLYEMVLKRAKSKGFGPNSSRMYAGKGYIAGDG